MSPHTALPVSLHSLLHFMHLRPPPTLAASPEHIPVGPTCRVNTLEQQAEKQSRGEEGATLDKQLQLLIEFTYVLLFSFYLLLMMMSPLWGNIVANSLAHTVDTISVGPRPSCHPAR